MFRGTAEIEPLVDLLLDRNASVWHACQLADFGTYLGIGGIPSRKLVETRRLSMTPFETDATDRANDVWDKVFLNMSDFGTMFWSGRRAVPNPFGPITFQFSPGTLLRASDVAVCLRSAGARDFDRDAEALHSVDEVDDVFVHDQDAFFPESAEVRHGHRLQERFEEYGDTATSCEISTTVTPSFLPFEDLVVVWVDPVVVDGVALIDRVRAVAARNGRSWRIHHRNTDEVRRGVYAELVALVRTQEHIQLRLLGSRQGASAALRDWADAILERDLEWQFQRWYKYLRSGTVVPLKSSTVPSGVPLPRRAPHVTSQ